MAGGPTVESTDLKAMTKFEEVGGVSRRKIWRQRLTSVSGRYHKGVLCVLPSLVCYSTID